jgi:hypothetical protein
MNTVMIKILLILKFLFFATFIWLFSIDFDVQFLFQEQSQRLLFLTAESMTAAKVQWQQRSFRGDKLKGGTSVAGRGGTTGQAKRRDPGDGTYRRDHSKSIHIRQTSSSADGTDCFLTGPAKSFGFNIALVIILWEQIMSIYKSLHAWWTLVLNFSI